MDGWMDEGGKGGGVWMDGWMDGWMDEWMDGFLTRQRLQLLLARMLIESRLSPA